MKRLLLVCPLLSLMVLVAAFSPAQGGDKDGWVAVFNGKDLDGWKISYGGKANKDNSSWKVVDGMIVSDGEVSHLFSPRDDYKNFEARAEI